MLCLVEYKSFGSATDIDLPDVSLCIDHPFLYQKLKDLGTNTTAYYQHLSGDNFNESLASINYTNVTFDLEKYYHSATVRHDGKDDDNIGGEIHTRFNGFFYDTFIKCYGLVVKTSKVRKVEYIDYYFKLDTVLQSFLSTEAISAVVHGPSEIMLSPFFKVLKFDSGNHTNGGYLSIQITKAEVVKRRNKPKDPCVMQWRNWNDLVLFKIVKRIGCLPSYLESNLNFPTCSGMNETKRWYDIWEKTRKERDILPCQQMPRIDFEITSFPTDLEGFLVISVGYPDLVQIITQSRAVDVNSLIGNIGGYIGLFLGK